MKKFKTLLYTTFTDPDGEIDFTEMMHVLALLLAIKMFTYCCVYVFSAIILDEKLIEFEFRLFAVLEGTYRTKQGIKDFTIYKNGGISENTNATDSINTRGL